METGTWILELEKSARRFSLVFLHLGSAFGPQRAALSDINGKHISVPDYLSQDSPADPTLLVIDQIERLEGKRDSSMGRLRERIFADIEGGHVFILVSTLARNTYDDTPGSDLLADARHVFAPVNEPSDENPLTVLPSFSIDDDSDGRSLLVSCLQELGSSTVLAVGQALWEDGHSPRDSILRLKRTDIEALRGAGLVFVTAGEAHWSISQVWKDFRESVALATSMYTKESPWLSETFSDLWVMERAIRNSIRFALMKKQGNSWRTNCLTGGLKTEVLERARKDAHPSAESIKELRDPLEWLTTVELLDLRETRELGNLGLEPYLWRMLQNTVVPIRNRAAHMRIISDEDAQNIQKWRKMVVRKLTV